MYDFKYPDILPLPSLPASFPHSVYDDSRSWYQELVNIIEYCNEVGNITNDMQAWLKAFIETYGKENEKILNDLFMEWSTLTMKEWLQTFLDKYEEENKIFLTDIFNTWLSSDKTIAWLKQDAPKAVSLIANMVDKSINYVYTGEEVGYVNGNWYYWSGSQWTSGGIYQSRGIDNKTIEKKKLAFPSLSGVVGTNLIDLSSIVKDTFIKYTSGQIYTLIDYSSTDYINVKPNSYYRLSGTKEQIAFYDANKIFISGMVDGSLLTITPPNAYFVRITFISSDANKCQLELGNNVSDYTPYSINFDYNTIKDYIPESKIDDKLLRGVIGNNIFNYKSVLKDYYVKYTTGEIFRLDGYCVSDFIKIKSNSPYRISGTNEQIALYDANKNYIDGYVDARKLTLTPINAEYIRITLKTSELNSTQLENSLVSTQYESYGYYFNDDGINKPIPFNKLDESLLKGSSSKNLFNYKNIYNDRFIKYDTGVMYTISGYSSSDFILVSPSTSYRISGTKEQMSFYDINKTFISGLVDASLVKTTPDNAYYIRITLKSNDVYSVQVEKGENVTFYEKYGYHLNNNDISDENIDYINNKISGTNIINVKKDLTGDFASLVDALRSIKDSSPKNKYEVYIYDDHDMVAELGGQTFIESLNTQANSNRRGVFLPSYVNLHGVNKVRLYGKIDSSWNINYWTVQAISLLEISAGFNFCENITFDAQNMRYAIHDETNGSVPNTTVKWKDCEFIHRGNSEVLSKGNWTSVVGYGMGSSSGTKRYWDNCIFDSSAFYGFSIHDNADFLLGTQLKFESCEFYNRGGNTSVLEDLKLSTYSTGTVTNLAVINNCILKKIAIINETTGTENRWKVKGGGNSVKAISNANATVPLTILI